MTNPHGKVTETNVDYARKRFRHYTSTSASNWAGNIKHCLESYGFQGVWTDGAVNEKNHFLPCSKVK